MTPTSLAPEEPVINRDGSTIAFITRDRVVSSQKGRLYTAHIGGDEPVPITPEELWASGGGGGNFNGNTLAFIACDPVTTCIYTPAQMELYLIEADGSSLRPLSDDAYSGAVISSDGSTTAFVRRVWDGQWYDQLIAVHHSDGTEHELFVGYPGNVGSVSLNGDGSMVSFLNTASDQQLYVMQTDGLSEPQPALTVPYGGDYIRIATMSGDGSTIAYVNIGGGLYVVKTAGELPAEPLLLDSDAYDGYRPSLTYDGSQVCYVHALPSSPADVYLINSDGTARQAITNASEMTTPDGDPLAAWSPAISEDGSAIVFLSNADFVTGANPLFLNQVFVAVLAPSLSVDGKWTSTRPQEETFSFTGHGYTPDQDVNLTVVDPDMVTTKATVHADALGGLSWPMPTSCATVVGEYMVTAQDGSGRASRTALAIVEANVACPVLLVDGGASSTHQQLETFVFDGSGFTPSGTATVHVKPLPDGPELPLPDAQTVDEDGRITWQFTPSCSYAVGSYGVRAVDDRTGLSSNSVTETVSANPQCLDFTAPVAGPIAYSPLPVDSGEPFDETVARTWYTMVWTGRYSGDADTRGEGTGGHPGVDIRAVYGIEHGDLGVYSIGDGTVEFQGCLADWGNVVVVRHEDVRDHGTLFAVYAHLASFAEPRSPGDLLERQEKLGTMGGTSSCSRSTYPIHLHYQIQREWLGYVFWPSYTVRTDKKGNVVTRPYPIDEKAELRLTDAQLQEAVSQVRSATVNPMLLVQQY